MDHEPDAELLSQYLRGSQAAFAQLVRRHADWVYAVARRRVGGDAHAAEDVTQAVFIVLARKAHRVRAARGATLAPWLFQVTRLTASRATRDRARRRRHETEAALMHERQRRAIESSGPPHASDAQWTEVEPLLDESVASLRETDRRAVLLRFYQRKTFGEVASAIGATEEAARKRVARAVDRLRLILGRRGVALPAGALPAMLWNHTAASSAPATVVAAVSCAAPASVVAASTHSALLAKAAILMIGLHKAKSAAVAAVVLILTGAAGVALVADATAQVDPARAHEQRQPATAPAADAAEKQQKLMQVTPILQVEDLQASLDYYVTHLGFQTQFTHGDPANFASIQRDGLAIFLQQGGGHGGTQAWVYLMVSDVDALHEEIKERGAEVADAPVDRPWGMREMLLVDPDGNRLRVGTMRH